MEYNFREIERKWQEKWAREGTFRTSNDSSKPKYYSLDMFPYPSGAGLHVGHPLGYIASDIVSRYKRHRGFNVLHPMGFDSFGLPAEQYAIETGQHPSITTKENIARYREQLDKMGFSFDWERQVRTSDPGYYKWTQWIFLKLFKSWYNKEKDRAESIETLTAHFEKNGNAKINAVSSQENIFSAEEWMKFSEKEQQNILMNYRLAYLSEAFVNWCPGLGTVLANDEVKDGVSERGGFPVERKLMPQWSLRITAYADRLLKDLENIDWSESIKESQRNWIGRSEGTSITFNIQHSTHKIEVFTTRPDTIFGVSFLTLAPESEFISMLTTPEQKAKVDAYVTMAKNRSERERMADVKKISGEFTGAYAVHPFSGKMIPIWIGDYVLAGYGTGAVMAVPAHDSRDHAFAKHFGLPIPQVVRPAHDGSPVGFDIDKESYDAKEGEIINSDFLNGLEVKAAVKKAIEEVEKRKIGKGQVNFRMRDAIFGRQRYWGEPIPIYYIDGVAHPLKDSELPLLLPDIDKFLPTETGEPPLARAKNWKYKNEYEYEKTTMPGWAGSSWYYLRYMDAKNEKEFASKDALDYWENVDLYIGGSEHATGHLLYVRFWTKFLYDLGLIKVVEPAKKLINQGMIQGTTAFVYRINGTNKFVSLNLKDKYETSEVRVNVEFVDNNVLDISKIKQWREEFANAEFILEDGKYICGSEVEKMSKSKFNVVNPDDMCNQYGADTFRMYEMFLGPLEQSKPWNTNGISGVHSFLKKLCRLFASIDDSAPSKKELKALHKAIKKVSEDVERYAFNTSVSTFMICVNELADLKCSKRAILEPLVILLSPYAPHIAEELWEYLGHKESISTAPWPEFNAENLVEDSFAYPIQFNGKTRFNLDLSLSLSKEQVEKEVLAAELTKKYLEGKEVKKVIVVQNKIVNIVS
jgi:leucyl-tRNA synthetase